MFKLFLWSCLLGSVFSVNILVVLPHPGKSHFDVFEPLVFGLVSRGHHVTVISFFPQASPITNLTDISLVGVAPIFVNVLKFEYLTGMNSVTDFLAVTQIGVESCGVILKSRQIQNFLKLEHKFDLILVEMFNTDCFLGFVGKFEAPYIGLSSSSLMPTMYPRLGSFDNFANFPNLFFPYTPRMNFQQRVVNCLSTLGFRVVRWYLREFSEQKIAHEVFGKDISLQKVVYNMSLALVNSHFSLQGERPLPPGFVEVGGLHIHGPKPIDKDLEKFLNDSTKDVLLFSMGSVLQSSSFPEDKRQAFMDAFKELPVNVLMKWESDTLPGKPDNVRLSRWLPQRDLLAHPKVVAFMAHGGLLSASEAVYCGVPMVLIPMFGDQPNNVAHLEATGAAYKLNYQDITKESVLKALRAVLFDKSYRDNAQTLSERYRDRPMSPLDTAVYWTEYVIRHKGARHLRSAAVDMPWYQLWLLDVIAFIFTSLAVISYVIFWIIKRLLSLCKFNKSSHVHKKKD